MVCIVCFFPHAIERSQAQTRERLIPFEQEDLWGYKSSSGQVVIEPQFHFAGNFSPEGIAGIIDDNGPAYIDKKVQKPESLPVTPQSFAPARLPWQLNPNRVVV
jgi:WG containing repeat